MIKDIINVGKANILSNFTKLEIENIMKDLMIDDVYKVAIQNNKDDLVNLIEILSVSLVALKGQNTLLQERVIELENHLKNKK